MKTQRLRPLSRLFMLAAVASWAACHVQAQTPPQYIPVSPAALERARAADQFAMKGRDDLANGNAVRAEANFREALRGDSQNPDAWVGLGDALAKQNRFLEAVAAYRLVMYPTPQQGSSLATEPRAMMRYAILLAQTKQWPEAVQFYENALPAASPSSASSLPPINTHFSPNRTQTSLLMAMAYLRIGRSQISHGDDKGASESFAQAILLQPNRALAHLYAAERPDSKTTRKAELEKAALLGRGAVKDAAEKELKACR